MLSDLQMPSTDVLKKAINTHEKDCLELVSKFKITYVFMATYGF